MISSKFDIVIFGASGYIGRNAILEAVALLVSQNWAVAGRSKEKLSRVLKQVGKQTDKDLSKIPIIIANANDKRSIKYMTQLCKVLINCSGPHQQCAETIIARCIKSGTHYVDACCDAYFNELMQLRYNDKAKYKKVYIVSACGFNSFPIEIGMNILQENFLGTINFVNVCTEYTFNSHTVSIAPIASTTAWTSMIMGMQQFAKLPIIRKNFRQKALPALTPKPHIRQFLHKPVPDEPKTYLRSPFIDQQVVERTQYHFYANEKRRPIQFYKYLAFPSFFLAFVFLIWSFIIILLAQFKTTRSIIAKYWRIFSLGLVSQYGPDELLMQNVVFKINFRGHGWSEALTKVPCNINECALDKCVELEIIGRNPIYKVGCFCLLISALLILDEASELPSNGGVYTPGIVFAKIPMLEKLQEFNSPMTITFKC